MGKHALSGIDGVKRSDLFYIDPAIIQIQPGWNDRIDFSGEPELIESIKENGVLQPLRVKKDKDNNVLLVDGERRLRATRKAIKEGCPIKAVPVIVAKRNTNDLELYLDSLLVNTGKRLTPVEESNSFQRLLKYGLSVADISKKTGRSESHVRNRLELANAGPELKQAVNEKAVTVSQAQEIVKDSDGDLKAQGKALKKAKKEKATTPKTRPLSLFFKGGAVHYAGGNQGQTCEPLADLLISDEFKTTLSAAGFDPESIKISIKSNRKEK